MMSNFLLLLLKYYLLSLFSILFFCYQCVIVGVVYLFSRSCCFQWFLLFCGCYFYTWWCCYLHFNCCHNCLCVPWKLYFFIILFWFFLFLVCILEVLHLLLCCYWLCCYWLFQLYFLFQFYCHYNSFFCLWFFWHHWFYNLMIFICLISFFPDIAVLFRECFI